MFFVGQIFFSVARMFAAHYESFVPAFFKVSIITETRPLKNVDRENANKWKMTLI